MESWTVEYWEKNVDTCKKELSLDNSWEKIPLMNATYSHLLKDGQLVRFRGMIQDMYNPVYYLSSYEVEDTKTSEKVVRSGKYKDSLQCAEHERVLFDSDQSVNQERRPVYCITVPAVNQWAQTKKNELTPNEKPKCEPSSGSGVKRSAAEDDQEMVEDNQSNLEGAKRLCSTGSAMETESSSQITDLNLPIPSGHAQACLVNLYDTEDGILKINDIIEAVGFLSYDPASVTSSLDGLPESLPPPSLVPRIHAVAMRPLHSCNPLVTPEVSIGEVMQNAARLRSELKLLLTQLLLGDSLAADYLICHLISRIYLRQDMQVLGKFSLNLSNIPQSLPDYTTQLYQFLETVLDKSHYLPMTLDKMNTVTMIPKKNYETNRLESGLLQLSEKTHLVVDETRLEPGQLNDKGVRNCRALGSVITNQQLEYDFQFYPVPFNTDIPVLILSDGKSLLPSDCHLPLEADPSCLSTASEVFSAAAHYLKEPLLSEIHVYLSLISTADYDLTPEVQKLVQEDFVQMRKEQPKTNAQDLHALLVLAKLLALSEGSRCLTKEFWDTAKQMEAQRKIRASRPIRR